MTPKWVGPQHEQPEPHSCPTTMVDLAALALILTAVVALVVFGSATAAVLAAAGGAVALCYRTWRGHHTGSKE
ncbi:hypothetical protein [Nocardia sp. NBC_01327]|uniref:hypothetical protein n=1 Tax=Nocardia sp. NBC_01327 TaxID=2903593 RepID=UPI002E0FD790|nr:hypothetical protein OG326_29360 [Nocardia sp. NBC_01327]